MIKDKKKPTPVITDDTSIISRNPNDLDQCPYCRCLFTKGSKHSCKESGWGRFSCTLCNMQLDNMKEKYSIWNGHKVVRMRSKKHYYIASGIVCWNCAFKIVKEFKKEADPK